MSLARPNAGDARGPQGSRNLDPQVRGVFQHVVADSERDVAGPGLDRQLSEEGTNFTYPNDCLVEAHRVVQIFTLCLCCHGLADRPADRPY